MSESGDTVQQSTEADVNAVQKQEKVKENSALAADSNANSKSASQPPTTSILTEEDDAEGDSEAETWIQSPEKRRGLVPESAVGLQVKTADSDAGSTIIANTSDKENSTRKRKRVKDGTNLKRSPSVLSSRRSSPLSSPAHHADSDDSDSGVPAKRKLSSTTGYSEAEMIKVSPKRRPRRPSEIVPPSPTQRRSKRSSIDASERRETRSATFPRPSDDEKSVSPEPVMRHEHRRVISTQLTSGEMGEKKRRGRPPNLVTKRHRSVDRASEDSADSDTRRPRPSLSSLAKLTSQDAELMSPARPASRKLRDKIGRTPLARACHNGDLDVVKIRYAERPQDLHVQDNAENTPLQIACLEGHDEVVEFLISQGAEVNIQNNVKDTPLIDAVENGHVDVVRLLLKHGANPRLANQNGDEPVDLITEENDNGPEITALLEEAREQAKKALGIDANDVASREGASSRAASAASPRDSPPVSGRSPSMFGSRRRTGRSEPTRNDLLYEAKTPENLIRLAGKGDVQAVVEIVQVLPQAPTEALIAAARGGHQQALEMLIGLGRPDPDPEPIRNNKMASGQNTPMLAAIGRGHPKIVKLLAEQGGFNPTKKYGGRTYFELAEERKGERWEEEVKHLKEAYTNYKNKKSQSPRKSRDPKPKVRPRRRSSSAGSTMLSTSSPEAHRPQHVFAKPKESANGEKRKVSDPTTGRHKSRKDDDNDTESDTEQTTSVSRATRPRRSQSDLPPMSIVTEEPAQKRRRLVSGKEHRNRQSFKTSSDDDEDMIEEPRTDRSQPALKRTRSDSTSDLREETTERASIKKRRTVVESSPAQPTMPDLPPAPSESTPADVKQEPSLPEEPLLTTDPESLPDADTGRPTVERHDLDQVEYLSPPTDRPATGDDEAAKIEQVQKQAEKEKADKEAAAAVAEEARLKKAEEAEKHRQEEARAQLLKQQEEERAEAEAQERQQAEEKLRQQKADEENQRRAAEQAKVEQEERRRAQERDRIDSLPLLLARTAQLIDEQDPEAISDKFLRKKYLPLYSVKTEQLHASTDNATSLDKWVPSFQVAGLLSTKDLGLSQYPALGRMPATDWEIRCMWRWARLQLSYELDFSCFKAPTSDSKSVERTAEQKFFAMADRDQERPFWVKYTDFLAEATHKTYLQHFTLGAIACSVKKYGQILAAHPSPPLPVKAPALVNGNSIGTHTNGLS